MTPQDQQQLERLVTQAVHNLPPRRAPATLVARVEAEIARRAALPWWRKSFVHWPFAARAALVVVCAAIVRLILTGTSWVTDGFDLAPVKATFASELAWMQTGSRLLTAATDIVSTLLGSIPALWLYGGAAVIVALYVALFGLGAAAYRTLYASS